MDSARNDTTHLMGTQLLQQLKLYAPDRVANLDISAWWRDRAFFDPEEVLKIVEDAGYIVSLSKSKDTLFCVPRTMLVSGIHAFVVDTIASDGHSTKKQFTTFAAIAQHLKKCRKNITGTATRACIYGGSQDLELLQDYLLSNEFNLYDSYTFHLVLDGVDPHLLVDPIIPKRFALHTPGGDVVEVNVEDMVEKIVRAGEGEVTVSTEYVANLVGFVEFVIACDALVFHGVHFVDPTNVRFKIKVNK